MLSARARDNCASSGISSAPAPIGNYQFDVHIDRGPLGFGGTMFAIALQDLVLTPVWTALVWLVHALLVALEWCYSLDLLGGGPLNTIGDALRSEEATFTQPWLVLALAISGALLVYHGIVRRRVAESLGAASLTVVMVVVGLWLIADPAGTVGVVSHMVNQSSLGTLAAIDAGTPDHAARSFADATGGVFRATVTAPWCYLEFGDVGWCSDPSRVDQRLRVAAARIAADDRSAAGCSAIRGLGGIACAPSGGTGGAGLRAEADLLAAARTNGDFFLALPANGTIRNSINDDRSLLRVMCQTADATACSGPTAAQAEFRTQSGTWARAGGLLFIAIGVAGTLVLLAFIGLRLLAAAVLSVVYLLLAPLAVIAPALGEAGRDAFHRWAVRLLATLVAKLVYSVLLGTLLLMLRILLSLGALGWWTQWLLMAAFWWVVFIHRHELLAHVFRDQQPSRARTPRTSSAARIARIAREPVRIVAKRAGPLADAALEGYEAIETRLRRRTGSDRRFDRGRTSGSGGGRVVADAERQKPRRQDPRVAASVAATDAGAATLASRALEDHVEKMIERQHAEATAIAAAAHVGQAAGDPAVGNLDERRRQSLTEQLAIATAAGQRRRVVSLKSRLARLDARVAEHDAAVHRAGRALGTFTVGVKSGALQEELHQELDRQASLPRGVNVDQTITGGRRDYGALTALIGVQRSDYERMQAGERRRVRLQIDRELDRRQEWSAEIGSSGAQLPWRVLGEGMFSGEQVEELLGWSCR